MDVFQFIDFGDSHFWYLISFVAFVVFLSGKIKQGIVSMLDARIAGIKKDLEEAEALRTEAQETLAQFQRKYRDVVKEVDEIIENAKTSSAAIKRQATENLQARLERQEKQLEERIALIQAQTVADIRQYAADLAIEGTRQIIVENLSNATREQLVDQSIKTVEPLVKH